jgi:hypothetical protein
LTAAAKSFLTAASFRRSAAAIIVSVRPKFIAEDGCMFSVAVTVQNEARAFSGERSRNCRPYPAGGAGYDYHLSLQLGVHAPGYKTKFSLC